MPWTRRLQWAATIAVALVSSSAMAQQVVDPNFRPSLGYREYEADSGLWST
jgi:hypothetical protein